MRFGVIVAHQQRPDALKTSIGVALDFGANHVPKITTFAWKSSNGKEVNWCENHLNRAERDFSTLDQTRPTFKANDPKRRVFFECCFLVARFHWILIRFSVWFQRWYQLHVNAWVHWMAVSERIYRLIDMKDAVKHRTTSDWAIMYSIIQSKSLTFVVIILIRRYFATVSWIIAAMGPRR